MATNAATETSPLETTENYGKRQVALQRIEQKLQQIKNETTTQVHENLEKSIREIMRDLQENELLSENVNKLFNNNYYDEIQDKVKTKKGHLPDKHFTERNSLLTDLFEVKHIQTIYHMFLALLFGLFVNTTTYDLLHKGKISLGFDLMFISFRNINSLLFVWTRMFLSTLMVYVGFHFWTNIRTQLPPKSLKLKLWDRLLLCVFIVYMLWFIYFFTNSIIFYELTLAESVAALCELTRLLMKTYAFVRSNLPRAISYKLHNEDEAIVCPEFTKYLYFLFVPTLIYKDDYPRTKKVRWNFVAFRFTEVLGCILYVGFVIERFLIPAFEDFGKKSYKWQDITMIILGNGMAGLLVLLCTFYAILHAWMNGFAEMLRFADRMFYKDWWTSTSYGRYYRTWNVVVHDWLYTYIYKDIYENVCPKNKIVAKLMVFFVSALFHEYILGFGFRFCYPVLFVLFFGFGLAMSFVKLDYSLMGNSAMWYSLALGTGIAVSTYCMEFYARINCPIENETVIDYFIPRSFTCKI